MNKKEAIETKWGYDLLIKHLDAGMISIETGSRTIHLTDPEILGALKTMLLLKTCKLSRIINTEDTLEEPTKDSSDENIDKRVCIHPHESA